MAVKKIQVQILDYQSNMGQLYPCMCWKGWVAGGCLLGYYLEVGINTCILNSQSLIPSFLKYYIIRFENTYARSMEGGTLNFNLKSITPIISLLGYYLLLEPHIFDGVKGYLFLYYQIIRQA